MQEISQNSGALSPNLSNSTEKDRNAILTGKKVVRNYTEKQFRDIVFLIRVGSKGKLGFKEISRKCDWNGTRVIQILGNFNKYFPKTPKYQKEIFDRLTNLLIEIQNNSLNRINEQEGENAK